MDERLYFELRCNQFLANRLDLPNLCFCRLDRDLQECHLGAHYFWSTLSSQHGFSAQGYVQMNGLLCMTDSGDYLPKLSQCLTNLPSLPSLFPDTLVQVQ